MTQSADLNRYERAIVRNAGWFSARQTREGMIDADGDEFYGLRGDATLVGHSVTVRCLAGSLAGDSAFFDAARASLQWLAARQDHRGGWRRDSAFTLDGAQCVFEGFNTYEWVTGDRQFRDVLVRAADRMVAGTVDANGDLLLPDIIEIGEYAHFALLAWKTTGEERFRAAGACILGHIARNFDEAAGYWNPFDSERISHNPLLRIVRPPLRAAMLLFAPRGRLVARMADTLAPLVVGHCRPQYAMSLLDAEALLDTLDGSCVFPELARQTRRAIDWAEQHCSGPFPGSLTESCDTGGQPPVYPIRILNETHVAALWPSCCLLIAYCGLNDPTCHARTRQVADWIVSTQDDHGGFSNFTDPDGTRRPLQSGNVNYYACIALWLFNEVYNHGRVRLFTAPRAAL